jgi:hypothetical protein
LDDLRGRLLDHIPVGVIPPSSEGLNCGLNITSTRWIDLSPEASTMNMFRAPLIAAAVLTMTSCATFAQVRIITPDSEHLYSTDPRTPGQQLPDDETLRLQNERAESAKILRLREREDALRQQELDAAAAAQAAPTAYDEPYGYYEPYGAQDGSYFVGTFRSRQGRHVKLRGIGIRPVSGNSFQFRHANARLRR